MEIPDENLEKGQELEKNTKTLKTDELEINTLGLAAELLSSHAQTRLLSHIRELHQESINQRNHPDKAKQNTPLTGIEIFLRSDHPSHLLKIAELENQIQKSRRTVEILDSTDHSGKTLYDFIPKELQKELEDQIKGLKNWKNIKETLESEVASACGEIWDDYKRAKAQTEKEHQKTLETLLLGPEATQNEKEELEKSKKHILQTETLSELVGLEKARLAVRAITANPKEYPEKFAEAEKILGNDLRLIIDQVSHMEKLLEEEWLKSDPDIGIINDTDVQNIISPTLASKMEPETDEKGKPTGKVRISEHQKKLLESAYSNAKYQRTEKETPQDRLDRKISFILTTIEILETGKKTTIANALKKVRDLQKDQPQKTNPAKQNPLPDEKKETKTGTPQKIAPTSKRALKKTTGKKVSKTLKEWGQFLVIATLAKCWGKAKNEVIDSDGKNFGNHEEFVEFMRANIGEINTIT